MSDKGHACSNCRFFRQAEADPDGQCRKNPPLGHVLMLQRLHPLSGKGEVSPSTIGYWPVVTASNWCGAWEAAAATEGDA